MGKQVKRNFVTFPSSHEVIKEHTYIDLVSSWKNIEKHGDSPIKQDSNSSSSISSSSRSSDLMEDASSSSSNGPLHQLSGLMDQLPIKRGLSKNYQGKSQSFVSLASVESLEDLAKRENPYTKRIKLCKSFCGGFDAH